MVTKATMNVKTSLHMNTAPVLCLTPFISYFILSIWLHAQEDVQNKSTRESQKLTGTEKRPKYVQLGCATAATEA